jgi:hypothetical protein
MRKEALLALVSLGSLFSLAPQLARSGPGS